MKDIVLRLVNLTKKFGSLIAVNNLNIEVNRGEIFGFLGPNGAGKTTTIRMIVGLIKPTSGFVEIDGINIQKDFLGGIKRIGAIVESPAFYPYFSGRKNLEILLDISNSGLSGKEKQKRISELLARVNLEDRGKDKVSSYSQGMKQRLGIAGALIAEPEIIILDEPTNGLDPAGMKEIRELIKNLARDKDISVFLSSHLLNEVEQICDRVGIIDKGNLISLGEVKSLLKRSFENFVIVVNNAEKIFNDLKNEKWIIDVKIRKDREIHIKIDCRYSEKLGSLLHDKGIYPEEITKVSETLEEYFLRVTTQKYE